MATAILSKVCNCQDTSGIFDRRVQNLKELTVWLKTNVVSEKPTREGFLFYDSATAKNWFTFDKAIDKYFNKSQLDSMVNRDDGGMFSPRDKIQLLKGLLFQYWQVYQIAEISNIRYVTQKLIDNGGGDLIVVEAILRSKQTSLLGFFYLPNSVKPVSMTPLALANDSDE